MRYDARLAVLSLVFYGEMNQLSATITLAQKPVWALLRRLRANPKLKKAYVDVMQEHMDMKVVERVIDPRAMESSRKDLYFLLHRAVYDETRVSTKCCIVFDASAKTNNKLSLNNNLVCGPTLQLSILAIEIRF